MPQSVSSVALVSVSNAVQQLQQQLHSAQLENQRLTQALLAQAALERRRLGQTLHDDLGQYVAGMRAHIQLLNIIAEQPAAIRHTADLLQQQASYLQQGFQALVRDLSPAPVPSLSLGQLLHKLQQHWQQLHGLQCDVHIQGVAPHLAPAQQQHLQLLLHEVLTNAQRHAQATQVQIWLRYKQHSWRLLVRDNGSGGARLHDGLGLHSISLRAAALNAQLHIQARANRGWSIYLYAPLSNETPARTHNENTFSR